MNLSKIAYSTLFSFIAFTGCTETVQKKEEEKKIAPKKVIKKETPKKQISVKEKKQNFKDILVPIATEVYNELEIKYLDIKSDIDKNKNRNKIEKLKKEYNAKTDKLLLSALKPHPISILLAQAAAESAWLTSRFTKEANNIFGVWSFNKKEPRIAASGLRGDKTIYLKKYATVKEAVHDYYKNLGKTWAYAEFRKQRTFTNDPYLLSDYLVSYSEKKEAYTKLLKSMIKYNKFHEYDVDSKIIVNKKIIVPPIKNDVNESQNDINISKVDINVTRMDINETIIKIDGNESTIKVAEDENVSVADTNITKGKMN